MSEFKTLIESILAENNLLMEGIKEVKKYFPLINDEDFNTLISLDPTYKGSNELGKYGKWILSLYNNLLKDYNAYVKWEEQKKAGNFYPEPIKKSHDTLNDFENVFDLLKQFDVINKESKININTLKSISDLASVIAREKRAGISDDIIVNRRINLFKKAVAKGGKIVFKDNNWMVLVPETLESSVVFGNDTDWCTTTPNGEDYSLYLDGYKGKFFINLDLSNGNLYQFHFESDQFMNENDHMVEPKHIIKDEKLKQFYADYIKNTDTIENKQFALLLLGIKFSEEEKLDILRDFPFAISEIENPTEEMQLVAVTKSPDTIRYIKNPTKEVEYEAKTALTALRRFLPRGASEKDELKLVDQNPKYIRYIENPSEKVQLKAIKADPFNIRLIANPTKTAQLKAIKKDLYAIQFIKNPCEEVQIAAIKQNPHVIDYIENPTTNAKRWAAHLAA